MQELWQQIVDGKVTLCDLLCPRLYLRLRQLSTDTQGWIVCLAVLLLTVVRSGITYSFGLFVVKLREDYHVGMSLQNWIGTLSFCVSLTTAPISILVIRRLGPNGYQLCSVIGVLILSVSATLSSLVWHEAWMLLTHSALYGLGSSLTYMASSLLIVEYFDKQHPHHVMATSILLCGYPVASVIYNPFNGWLISTYDWRIGFRVNACLTLCVGLLCALLLVVPVDAETREPIQWHGDFQQRMFISCQPIMLRQRPQIVPWFVGSMMVYIGFYMPFVNLASYFSLEGVSIGRSSVGLLVLSLCECVTYMGASLAGDVMKGHLVYANIFSALALSLIWFLMPQLDTGYTAKLFFCAVIGAMISFSIVYQYAASGEVTKLPMDTAWAATNVWSGIGIFIGPFFSGMVYDIRKNYDDVFLVFGSLYLVQSLVFMSIPLLDRWTQSRIGAHCDNVDYEELKGMGPISDGVTTSFEKDDELATNPSDVSENNQMDEHPIPKRPLMNQQHRHCLSVDSKEF